MVFNQKFNFFKSFILFFLKPINFQLMHYFQILKYLTKQYNFPFIKKYNEIKFNFFFLEIINLFC